MRIKITVVFAVVTLILFIALIYFYYFKEETCYDKSCFLFYLRNCEKARYESDEWFYKIKGPKNNYCVVYVKNKWLNNVDVEVAKALNGKDMLCYIPRDIAGAYMPYEKIEQCHGLLKEAILDQMIKKMHLYIIQHIGEFNMTSVV